MENEPDKPRANTLLVILTMFDLIAAAAGAMPFAMASLIKSDPDALGRSDFPILMSVPAVAVVLIMVAWLLEATKHSKLARLTAAVPLLWGMVVLVSFGGSAI